MDADRRANISSFYSVADGRQPAPSNRSRADSSSSFFNPGARNSADMLRPGAPNSAGYNRDSFFAPGRQAPIKPGRDEEEDVFLGAGKDEAFDVYADFNNEGPRYASPASTLVGDGGYRPIPVPAGSGGTLRKSEDPNTPVELVTVPAMGREWSKAELKEMTRAGKRETKREQRAERWKKWNRDQKGICGSCITRRVLVFIIFGTMVVIGLLLAFTIPRVPNFQFNGQQPFIGTTTVTPRFTPFPANFTFSADVDLQVSTHGNFIPLRFTQIRGEVFDLDTLRKVGEGNLGGLTLPARQYTQLLLPVTFNYEAANDTDRTYQNWYHPCRARNQFPDGKRPGLKVRLIIEMGIQGLIGPRATSTSISGVPCPIELDPTAA